MCSPGAAVPEVVNDETRGMRVTAQGGGHEALSCTPGKIENVKPSWVICCTRRRARGAGGVRKGAFPDVGRQGHMKDQV